MPSVGGSDAAITLGVWLQVTVVHEPHFGDDPESLLDVRLKRRCAD